MPGGKGNIKHEDGNTFSSTNQPEKRRGVSLVSKLKQMLEEDPETVTKILKAVIDKAEKGDLKAADMILDRVDGKAPQTTDLTTNGKDLIIPIINFTKRGNKSK